MTTACDRAFYLTQSTLLFWIFVSDIMWLWNIVLTLASRQTDYYSEVYQSSSLEYIYPKIAP